MDILGTTTPANLLASVASGVQNTGADLWPFIVLIGIPLAFVIYGVVVSATKQTVSSKATDDYTPAQIGAMVEKIEEIEKRPGGGYP